MMLFQKGLKKECKELMLFGTRVLQEENNCRAKTRMVEEPSAESNLENAVKDCD